MFNSNNGGFTMPVAPLGFSGGGENGNGNGGFFGDSGIWAIIVILLLFGGIGGYGGYGGMGMGGGAMTGSLLYPWMNQAEITTDGFRDQMINTNVTSIRDSISDISTQLCNGFGNVQQSLCSGFAGVNATVNGAQNALAQQMYTNQISDLERSFAAQTANSQGFYNLSSQFADCCCENRLATANLGADIAREACATRTSDTQNTQVILNAINDGFRAMSDQRYQDKIDAKNDEIAQLRQENLYARGQASQLAQNQTIVDNIYNRLDSCPVGTTPVFGRTPIFNCNNNPCGCNNGCGCNGGF